MSIKTEIFYFREMIRYGYWHPRFWTAYIRNRYFWKLLLNKVKPVKYEADKDFELHLLSRKSDVWILVWAVKSFLHYSGTTPKIIIHDDGSMDTEAVEMVNKIFPGATVLLRKEADNRLSGHPAYHGRVKEFREAGHNLILKLIDIFLLSEAPTVMVLDSDILFFRKPQEVNDFVSGQADYSAIMSGIPQNLKPFHLEISPDYNNKYSILKNQAEYLNSGLIVYRKAALPPERLSEYLENTYLSTNDYFVEMTGWCSLIAQVNYLLLPPDKYILKGKPDDRTVMKHFTSTRRHEMFAWGIDKVRREMRE